VRRRSGCKRALGTRAPMAIPQALDQRWSLDFASDALTDRRRFRILVLVDDITRECLALVADASLFESLASSTRSLLPVGVGWRVYPTRRRWKDDYSTFGHIARSAPPTTHVKRSVPVMQRDGSLPSAEGSPLHHRASTDQTQPELYSFAG
jgi:hypothetical protein